MEPAATTTTAITAAAMSGATDPVSPSALPHSRAVTFTTATTYLFDVAYGGSALPKTTGPPIGLAPSHTHITHVDLGTSAHCRRGSVRKFTHLERIDMLKRAEYHVQDIAAFCVEALAIRKSRAIAADEARAEKQHMKRMLEETLSEQQQRATPFRRRMTMMDPSARLTIEA
ncbi:hypothetical protein DYB36_002917 [Aphanomyces astaci]|uniref:Cysteine/serine-rich nuclear protein N-terminal domain-containing protein n=1 Tax=Aphanomyces astaci TaxID=112090 RepID=A0A397BHK7_APHAT|nr:hypothetical protein DYB36_002917 [Aphanomyces astaci]